MSHKIRLSATIAGLLLGALVFCNACKDTEVYKLQRKMKPLAKVYLQEENIKDYKELTIECVDTITEVGYAQLTLEMLQGMAAEAEEQYANQEGDHSTEVQYLLLRTSITPRKTLNPYWTGGRSVTKKSCSTWSPAPTRPATSRNMSSSSWSTPTRKACIH